MENRIIPYGRQDITQEDIEAVVENLKSDFLTQGPKILEFEKAFGDYVGSKYAVAVSNGTAALHLCTLALEVQPSQKIITSPITFAASANCVRYCGGEVVFADIDPKTYLIDFDAVKNLLESAPKETYTGLILVDFAGRALNLEKFKKLAIEYNLWIIEDACHAPGGFFIDSNSIRQSCGNGKYADLAIFSFHPVKHIATGEGGMITTNNKELYEKLLTLRTHGITKNQNCFINDPSFASGVENQTEYPNWYMEMQCLGFNYRLTDFQSVLGLSQLKKASSRLKRRLEIAKTYNAAFENNPNILGHSGYLEGHAYHLYIIEVLNRLELYTFLREHNIYTQIHYIPCHLMPYYRDLGWKEGDLKFSENYYKHCISLPMFPTLTKKEQDFIIEKVTKFLKKK